MIAAIHKIQPLTSAHQTASEMVRMVKTYSKDIGKKARWPLVRFYNHVRALPFRADPKGAETVSRPAFTLKKDYPWRDCDDKAVLLGSWCYENRVPFRFRASSKHPNGHLHHVYTICRLNGMEIALDATYPRNQFGVEEDYTRIENLTGEIMNTPTLNTLEGDSMEMGSFVKQKAAEIARKKAQQKAQQKAFVASLAKKALAVRKKNAAANYGLTEKEKIAALQSVISKAGKVTGRIILDVSPATMAGDETEFLGSWWSSLKRKTKKVARKAYKGGKKLASNKGVQAALNAYLPGSGTALEAFSEKGAAGGISSLGTALEDKRFWIRAGIIGAAVVGGIILIRTVSAKKAA